MHGFGSYFAQIVELSIGSDGVVKPTRVWCVVDCGVAVNPNTSQAQMEGGIVFGLSAALHGEVTIKDGRVPRPTSATTACCACMKCRSSTCTS